MKLVRINHLRCGELSYNYTYVWVDVTLSEDDILLRARRAQDVYLTNLRAWKENQGIPVAGSRLKPDYEKWPNKTVAEIDAIHRLEREKYAQWQKIDHQSYLPFSHYLKEEGLTPVQSLDPGITLKLDWGHNHGLPIKYDATSDEDIPGPNESDW